MITDKIADYLEAQGCGKVGETIFQFEMPAQCKEGLLLLDGYYGTAINAYLPGYHKPEVRLIGRSVKLNKIADLMLKASKVLTFEGEFNGIPGLQIKQSQPQNLPRVYKRSVGGFYELEVDIDMALVVLG